MIKDAEDFAEEDKKVAERAVAKVIHKSMTHKLWLKWKKVRKSNELF